VKVLTVVEDDSDMRLVIRITLYADQRLEISGEAATADEAIELARELQPDLIVLDHYIEGPVMGLEAAPKMKSVAPDAKILLFTSHDLSTEASREPAIDGYLQKNNIRQLLPTVQRMLGIDIAA
jgi:DNA-binding NarL/FixJ family response regulator